MLRVESSEEQTFRQEVAAWLEAAIPAALKHTTRRAEPEQCMPWYRQLAQRGWIAPHWPRRFGGMEASPIQQVILMEEMAKAGAPDIPTQGLNHIGPLLMECGTPAQRQRHLPAILAGDEIWCQGYSEPGAGSDLASLRTRAEVREDSLLVNGHKIWTTWGHHAHWMFALVRTSTEDRRQKGITFVLIDMSSPGISRRPIRTIAEDDEFCEVFFDNVEVPLSNVVGEIGDGWSVATAVLAQERLRLGAPAHAFKALERLRALCAIHPDRQWAQALLAKSEIDVETLTASYLNVAENSANRGVESSYLKILATETVQRVLDGVQEAGGELACLSETQWDGDTCLEYSEMYLQSRRLSIYGGSNEIQRNIIAGRVLGLPSANKART